MNRRALYLLLGAVTGMMMIFMAALGYTMRLASENAQDIADQQAYMQGLRTRVYILEGEMNRGKWDAREALRREVFKGAIKNGSHK